MYEEVSTAITKPVEVKPWTRYKTRCGYIAEVYRIEDTSQKKKEAREAFGAVIIPKFTKDTPGWNHCFWDASTGKKRCKIGRRRTQLDLIYEIGPIKFLDHIR